MTSGSAGTPAAVRGHALGKKRDPTGRLQIDFDAIYERPIKRRAGAKDGTRRAWSPDSGGGRVDEDDAFVA